MFIVLESKYYAATCSPS